MEATKTVLVLGGGVGGVAAATHLRKALPAQHRVVLIEREAQHLFAPSLLWVMTGARKGKQITRPLERMVPRGVEIVRGEITKLEPESKRVTVGDAVLQGDFVVVSLGAETVPEVVPGLAEAGHNFYDLAGAETFFAALQKIERGRVIVLTAAPGYRCPAAPYEAALLVEAYLRKHGRREAVEVLLYAAEPAPMGVAGPAVSSAVRELLASRGIPYHPDHKIARADGAKRSLIFESGLEVAFDLLGCVPPHRAPRVVRESSLLGEGGWAATDRFQLTTKFPGVYAFGDVCNIPLKMGRPLPRAGVFAHAQAKVVAKNIAAQLASRPADATFDGHGECFLEVGDGKAGFASGNFYEEPAPALQLAGPARRYHAAKVLFEKTWLQGLL